MSSPKNEDPKIITDTISIVSNLLADYGWHVLAVILILVFVWNKYLAKTLHRFRPQTRDSETMATLTDEMEAIRRKQQEIYDKKVEEMKRKEVEKQNERKRQLNDLTNNIESNDKNELRQRSGKALRDNSFNPLMGSSSGTTYKPSRPKPSCGGCG